MFPTYTVSGHAGGLVSAPTGRIISPIHVRLAKIALKTTALMPEQGVRLLIVHDGLLLIPGSRERVAHCTGYAQIGKETRTQVFLFW